MTLKQTSNGLIMNNFIRVLQLLPEYRTPTTGFFWIPDTFIVQFLNGLSNQVTIAIQKPDKHIRFSNVHILTI